MAWDSAHWSAEADSLPGSATTITLRFAVKKTLPPRLEGSMPAVSVAVAAVGETLPSPSPSPPRCGLELLLSGHVGPAAS
ncbi:hypothetical protein HPP92_025738 [Vanilla planifolia]|uniref:Uncharacterized protein n=1 Tax=Vanilla planifolia TaxID=51239 RepID=A0A835U9A0_VANPL|nr:hypothetical protein HPP92_025738 [Vanilla planifolia]